MPLSTLDHPLIAKAQAIPDLVESHGAERIRAIADTVWFKTKVDDWRGAVTWVGSCPLPEIGIDRSWWMGACGRRKEDSTRQDFYGCLPSSGQSLMPKELDWERWFAETMVAATAASQRIVRQAAAQSLRSGEIISFGFGPSEIDVHIRFQSSGEVYIAFKVTDVTDPRIYALLFSSFPCIPCDHWLMEPDGVAGLEPSDDEIIYSALIPHEEQINLLDEH